MRNFLPLILFACAAPKDDSGPLSNGGSGTDSAPHDDSADDDDEDEDEDDDEDEDEDEDSGTDDDEDDDDEDDDDTASDPDDDDDTASDPDDDDDDDDSDGDGAPSDIDCDDTNPAVHPDATEVCDGVDNDCDGSIDDEDDSLDTSTHTTWYIDVDGDGFGDSSSATAACASPDGHVEASVDGFDCDDAHPEVYPGAVETDCADPVDYNCDGSVGYTDEDGDGYAACEECHDRDDSIHPDAIEVCDGVDNNCNGSTDDADPTLDLDTRSPFYTDADGDGFGDETLSTLACEATDGFVDDDDGFDCDDTDPDIHPDADEICDEIDNDCDTAIDDNDDDRVGGMAFYIDHDADGFGSMDYTTIACESPPGYTDSSTDCNDLDFSIHPEADERCDGLDNNCDGAIDGDDAVDRPVWFLDSDSDGFGDDTISIASCMPTGGYSASGGDCDDSRSDISPGATELCDGEDNDCNGEIDDGDAAGMITWYIDLDGDGYGTDSDTIEACDPVAGYSASSGDCDDVRSDTYPDAEELCDAIDNNCDGVLDDGLTLEVHYLDMDGDGHGTPDESLVACATPPGYSSLGDDCHDGSAVTYPGATESCFDALDNDCNGSTDCEDIDSCKSVEPACWVCGDDVLDPDEGCDDGDTLDGDGCSSSCTSEADLSGLETEWSYDGRQVYVWKSNSSVSISTYDTFCEDRGLDWFTPDSAGDAQNTITTLADRDGYHTWIITKNNSTKGSTAVWGGYTVTVNEPNCMDESSSDFSAIRKHGCSMCDPDRTSSHGYSDSTRCWDSDHSYDWLVCEE